MTEETFKKKIKEEGDFLEFHCLDFKCQIIRHNDLKHLNGYIFLTYDNDYYGVTYYEIDVPIHYGWTYCKQDDDFWVIGFDCAHLGDITGQSFKFMEFGHMEREYFGSIPTYKDMNFVKLELEDACKHLQKKSKSYRISQNISKIFK